MDYVLMTKKLEAVRKEIRKNVFSLWIMDELERKFNEGYEKMIWAGNDLPYSVSSNGTFLYR